MKKNGGRGQVGKERGKGGGETEGGRGRKEREKQGWMSGWVGKSNGGRGEDGETMGRTIEKEGMETKKRGK